MFGLFKRPLPLLRAVGDLVAMLEQIREKVDNVASDEGIDEEENYSFEALAFVYILGWAAIQASNLSRLNRHRFSAELTGAIAEKISFGDSSQGISPVRMLQERINDYRYATRHAGKDDWAVQLVNHFMQYVAADTPDHVAMSDALYESVPLYIYSLRDFLSGLNKSYKFV